MDVSANQNIIPYKDKILERINRAKADGSGYGHRLSNVELLSVFGKNGDTESVKEIICRCRDAFGDDFDFIMPPAFVLAESPVRRDLVSKIIVELVWHKIEEQQKTGSAVTMSNEEVYRLFGFGDGENLPVELMLFSNDIDTMNPEDKFIRHASSGDVFYSTSEFNGVYKFFTYSGLSPKIVEMAYKKVCDARAGNLVRFSSTEIGFLEASDLYCHRTKSFADNEVAYRVEEFFNIMPASLVQETSPDFNYEASLKFFSKLIYAGECCVKFTPFIVCCDKTVFKQNVFVHGAEAIKEMIRIVPKSNQVQIEKMKQIKSLMIRAGVLDFEMTEIRNANGQEFFMAKPLLFKDIQFLTSLFSITSSDEKNVEIVLEIMRLSPEFCADVFAVSNAINVTIKAYDLASEHILPDKIVVLSTIKKLEEEVRLGKPITISKKLSDFADSIACDEEFKLIIKALEEFSRIESNEEIRKNLVSKIDQILAKNSK